MTSHDERPAEDDGFRAQMWVARKPKRVVDPLAAWRRISRDKIAQHARRLRK